MKSLRIFLLFAVFIFGATILRMLDVKATDSTAPKPGAVFRDCPDCPEMVVLPAGSFTMGSSAEEKSWAASHGGSMYAVADEAPQHQVSLPSFALGKYDVTRGEYAAFARETGYPAGDGCGRGRAISKYEKDPKSTWENPGSGADRSRSSSVRQLAGCASLCRMAELQRIRRVSTGLIACPANPNGNTPRAPAPRANSGGAMMRSGAPSHAWFRCQLRLSQHVRGFSARAARRIRWARSRRTHSAFTTWQGTFGSGPRTVTTTATPAFPPTGARTRPLRATPRRRTAKAIASELIAAARGCFRRGCCDRPPENAILPTTAMTIMGFRVARTLP